MPTAEQILRDKGILETVKVSFSPGTLFEPVKDVTSGEIYKSLPGGTLSLAVKGPTGPNEYYLAKPLGDVFEIKP